MSSYYGQYESNDNQSTDGTNEHKIQAGSSPIMRMAIVTKVIMNTEDVAHDVGTILFRFVNTDDLGSGLDKRHDIELKYARPANSVLVAIPAINEYVYITTGPYDVSERPDQDGEEREIVNYYYSNPIQMKGDVHNNASDGDLYRTIIDPGLAIGDAAAYEQAEADREEALEEPLSLGMDLLRVPLMTPAMFEGDVLINGRFGQTIKLSATISEGAGDNWRGSADLEIDPPYQKPITIIRNGLPEGASDRYVDNIKTDPSAIWLTNGQYIPELKDLKPFDVARSMNIGELFEHANLGADVNQCIIRSDRILSIARKEIYNWSEKGISLATRGTITLDSSMIHMEATNINLGSGAGDGEDDRDLTFGVRGEQLQKVLLELIMAFSTTTVTTAAGPGTLNPPPSLNQLHDDVVDGQETGLFSKKVFLE